MAVVAQLVEPRVVISVVVGSSPISRPTFYLSFYISKLNIISFANLDDVLVGFFAFPFFLFYGLRLSLLINRNYSGYQSAYETKMSSISNNAMIKES